MGGEGDTCVWTVAFSVSKGTYIRALARDLGRACDSAAHISALRRTASGVVSIGACHAVEELSAESAAGFALDPIAALGATRVDLPGILPTICCAVDAFPLSVRLRISMRRRRRLRWCSMGDSRRSPVSRAAALLWSTSFRRRSAVFDDAGPHELARIFFAGESDEARIVTADAFDECEYLGAASIAIGVFDGVHRGHQELIEAVVRDARDHGCKAVVVTFDPDPDVVVSPSPAQKLMTTADRLHALAQTGVDAVVAVPFTPAVAALDHVGFLGAVVARCRHSLDSCWQRL
ncbi:MAG: hypothetical protein V8Q95_03945 [Collinsella sp.]